MRPRGHALKHLASEELLRYVIEGCPVDCEENWSREVIKEVIKLGPSTSAKQPEAIRACQAEASKKVRKGYWRLVNWEDIKKIISHLT